MNQVFFFAIKKETAKWKILPLENRTNVWYNVVRNRIGLNAVKEKKERSIVSKNVVKGFEEAFKTIIENEWEVKCHISTKGGNIALNTAIDQISIDYCGQKGICLEGGDNLIEIQDDGHLVVEYDVDDEMYIIQNDTLRCGILL